MENDASAAQNTRNFNISAMEKQTVSSRTNFSNLVNPQVGRDGSHTSAVTRSLQGALAEQRSPGS